MTMKKHTPITLRDIFAHRSLLYGLAGLWILFYHMKLAIPDSPLFAPLGFSAPPLIAALIAGLLAKENILTVLMLFAPAASLFPSSAAALSYLTFVALYAPCLASCAVLSRECQSRRRMLLAVLFQTAVAWLAALIIYQLFG